MTMPLEPPLGAYNTNRFKPKRKKPRMPHGYSLSEVEKALLKRIEVLEQKVIELEDILNKLDKLD